jgi:hypothetical protein
MNIEMAKDVATFIKSNKVCDLNVMGGEFFCNPYWYEILSILVDSTHSMRLVTNGDWVIDNEIADKVVEFINLNKNKVRIAISKDKWHTNKNIEKAEEYIKQTGALYHVALPSETTDSSIVPFGEMWEFDLNVDYSWRCCDTTQAKVNGIELIKTAHNDICIAVIVENLCDSTIKDRMGLDYFKRDEAISILSYALQYLKVIVLSPEAYKESVE